MGDLKWIVQSDLYNEYGYVKFMDALDRLDCDYTIVKPVPFSDILLPGDFDSVTDDVNDAADPVPDNSVPIITFGSTTLNRIAQKRNWEPGTFINENFHYSKWVEGFGEDVMLNPSGTVFTPSQDFFIPLMDQYFVRPTEDTKSISGTVMDYEEFHDWLTYVKGIPNDGCSPLNCETELVVSPVREIYAEYRFFVVGGEVVTCSRYKLGNQVIASADVDMHVHQFVGRMIHRWEPADAFVLDVAETPNGCKIIEVNNINSAGFYEANPLEIVDAIQRLVKYGRNRSPGTI